MKGDVEIILEVERKLSGPDSHILSRMEHEQIDEEEAEYRTWIDVYGEKIGHAAAVEQAKEMRARGEFKND